MAMSPEIEKEYQAALARAVVKNGSIVRQRDSFYGWHDYEAASHISGGNDYDDNQGGPCTLVLAADAKATEDEWGEFEGTFYEGDITHHGAIVKSVDCACGKLTGRSVRWEASIHEVAEAVFIEAFGARKAGA